MYISKEEQEKREAISLFKVHSDDDCANAIVATQERGRIPLFIRTPLCAINKAEISSKVVNLLGLDEATIEINLR